MRRITIGMLGCGTVGTGVLKILRDNAEDIRARLGGSLVVTRVAVRDPSKRRDPAVTPELLTADALAVVRDPEIDLVIEVIGGYEPARTLLLEALAAGKHVVTANKAVLARHGKEIFAAADANRRDVLFEGTVGGGIPIIRTLRESLASDRVLSLQGIINATSNFILTSMTHERRTYQAALAEAQTLGYAEADPTLDVGGVDAAQKLSILISNAWGAAIPFDQIPTEGIERVSDIDIGFARGFGYDIKPLAVARMHDDGIEARVHPALIPQDALLASVDGAMNAVRIVSHALGPALFCGQGAGMLPTAMSVVSDAIEMGRNLLSRTSGRLPHLAFHRGLVTERTLRDASMTRCPYYLRFVVEDRPGVLASIAGVLGQAGVSISRMVQEDARTPPVQVVMMTHTALEGAVMRSLDEIAEQSFVHEPPRYLRVEDAR
jgi:homoserine dehydrogenase